MNATPEEAAKMVVKHFGGELAVKNTYQRMMGYKMKAIVLNDKTAFESNIDFLQKTLDFMNRSFVKYSITI